MSLSFMRLASIRLAAGGVLALAAGCDFPPPPQQSTAAELQALTPAKTCQASLPVFGRFFYPGDVPPGTYIPPQGTIRMNNDGGWCMLHNVFVFRDVITVGTLSLVKPPAHGEVRTGTVGDELRIAYRPQPGFTGADPFVVHLDAPQPWDIPVSVFVAPGN